MKQKWKFFAIPLIVLFLVSGGLLLKSVLDRRDDKLDDVASLPVIKISLNETNLEEIYSNGKETKYENNDLELIDKGEVFDFSNVQIKGRGNSTWGGEKRPFQIKFKKKVDLLGLGLRKRYILLANTYDDSSLRNAAMFELTEMIGEKYRQKGEFVELFIDNDYMGLYYLTTKVEIEKNSVDLRDKYGILMELDTLHRNTEDCYTTGFKECLIIKEAVFVGDEEIKNKAVEDFLKSYNELEVAAKNDDFEMVRKLIDVGSFAEYYLISEFAVNPDAYVSSFFFYKNGDDDKIHAGPLWDYDFAFSNRNWYWTLDVDYYSPTETMVQKKDIFNEKRKDTEITKFMYYLIDIPEFREEVERIFQEKMSGRKNEFLSKVLNNAAKVREAAIRDEERWEKDQDSFYREIIYLLDWLSKRYDYFEEEYGEKGWEFKSGVI